MLGVIKGFEIRLLTWPPTMLPAFYNTSKLENNLQMIDAICSLRAIVSLLEQICCLTGNKTQRDNNLRAKHESTSSPTHTRYLPPRLYLSPAPSLADGEITTTDTSVNTSCRDISLCERPSLTLIQAQTQNKQCLK